MCKINQIFWESEDNTIFIERFRKSDSYPLLHYFYSYLLIIVPYLFKHKPSIVIF